MYLIKETKSFRKSYRKLKKSGTKIKVLEDIKNVVKLLSLGKKLPCVYKDHGMEGELKGYRDCHIRGDLVLIYTIKQEDSVLFLVNVDSHSNIF